MKKPHLWVSVLVVWALCIFAFERPLLSLLLSEMAFGRLAALAYFTMWLNFTWLYGIYHIAIVSFSRMHCAPAVTGISDHNPSIALLYTTMNDFSEAAALSCVSQDYPHFHVYLLDDSNLATYQLAVDQFQARFSNIVTVVRRDTKEGFKAGNLNHVLEKIAQKYEFFAICDADGILPLDFLKKLIKRFVDESIGFVQAKQSAVITEETSAFTSELAASVSIYWQHIVPASQVYGFVMFHGHGGIIRTRVWQEIGGFPLVVAEDLAFSTRAREIGYVGVIASDVECLEEFPSTYRMFVRRQMKYARGACEHLLCGAWRFITAPGIPWFEKLDRFIASIGMMAALPLLLFFVDTGILLPLLFPMEASGQHIVTQTTALVHGVFRVDPRLESAFSWPLYVVTILTSLGPLAAPVIHFWALPSRLMRYITVSITVHLSSIFIQARDIAAVALLRKNHFNVTGNHEAVEHLCTSELGILRSLKGASVALVTIAFATTAVATGNLGLLPLGLSAGFSIGANHYGWSNRYLRILLYLPPVSMLLLTILAFSVFLGFCGSTILVAAAQL